MVDVFVIGPFSPRDFSTLGDVADFAAAGAGVDENSINHKIWKKLGVATDAIDGSNIGTIKNAEPVTVLGNIFLVITR